MSGVQSALIALALISACGGSKPTPSQPVQVAAPQQVHEEESTSVITPEQRRAMVLDNLPNDRSIIVHLAWARLRASPMYSASAIFGADEIAALFGDVPDRIGTSVKLIKEKCGFDLVEAVESITLATSADAEDVVFAISGRIEQAEIERCITSAGGSVTSGAYHLGADVMHAYWPRTNLVLLSDRSLSGMKQTLESGSTSSNREMMSLLKATDSAATLWGGGLIPSSVGAQVGIEVPHSFSIQVKVHKDATLDLSMHLATEDIARNWVTMMSMGVQMMASQEGAAGGVLATLLKNREIRESGKQVLLRLKLSGEDAAIAPPASPASTASTAITSIDPATNYAVPIADSPSEGNPDALVTIVEGYEYACSFCNKARPTMQQLLKDYSGDLRIVYRSFLVHPSSAREPALAACAANLQGRFSVMNELLWKDAFGKRNFGRSHMETLAKKAKLKMAQFRTDRTGKCVEQLDRDQADLRKLGLSGTPGFWINGRFLSGARPIAQFKVLIDEELAKAKKAIAENKELSRDNYYERAILGDKP